MEKLNCKSLMLGDWVNFLIDVVGGETEYDPAVNEYQPMRIESIYASGDVESEFGVTNDVTQLQPIPLTAKILERNGFVFNNLPMEQCWQQYGLRLYLSGYGYAISCGENVSLRIDYVHELQHALRLCKIDREIKL